MHNMWRGHGWAILKFYKCHTRLIQLHMLVELASRVEQIGMLKTSKLLILKQKIIL